MAFCMTSTSIPSPTVFKYSTRLLVPKRATSRISVHNKFQCIAGSELRTSTVFRRSGNYHPSIWDEGYLLSLTSDYTDEIKIGDVPKALQCHINDTGCSEEAAGERIKELMTEGWKKVNLPISQ
ncbi:hypothetical protein Patl1_10234 [Pistacia atlantica]|uniref:Uncharacterized protein n=1 Tax=Pistacia atlantica TaxID=434234 RepID=A0ACC1A0R6_9ROSI|nr:hypothetical protein Patl1_10234 [Pistacia atlantica]